MSNNRVSEPKGLIRGGANVALSCALAASLTPAAALADTASSSSGSDMVAVAAASRDAVDITAQWKAGAAVISTGGRYVISEDFTTDGALVVNAPAGETVVIDLAGHCVEVRGCVQAAIVADNAQGEVVITDSSFTDALSRGERAADDAPSATLRLVATDASESVAAVRLNVSVDEEQFEQGKVSLPKLALSHVRVQAALAGVADGLEEGKTVSGYGVYAGLAGIDTALDVSLDGCCVDAVVSGEEAPEWAKVEGASVPSERAGIAASVATQVKGVSLAGANDFAATSVAGQAHLYATADDAFSAAAGATFPNEVSVYANGNKAGAKLLCAYDEDQARALAPHVVDAVQKLPGEASGSSVVIGREVPASSSAAVAQTDGASKEAVVEAAAPADEAAAVSCGSLAQPQEHEASLRSVRVAGLPLLQSQPVAISYLAEQSVDLSKAWTDRSQPFVISESGTYYLDADLASEKGNIQIKGDGITVRLVLNGHTLSFERVSGQAGIAVSGSAAVSVSNGSIEAFGTSYSTYGIQMAGSGSVALSNVSVRAFTTGGSAVGVYAPVGCSGSLAAEGGSIGAEATGEASAYGIQVIPQNVSVALFDCSIKAKTVSALSGARARGVETAGKLDAGGSAAASLRIEAACDSGAGSAVAVRASGTAEQSLSLKNCALASSSSCAAGDIRGDFWCIDTSSSQKAQLTLDGKTSFECASPADIKLAAPFAVGRDFANIGENRITVDNPQLTDDAFATLAAGADGAACATAFEAAPASAYAGSSAYVQGGKLAWSCSPVVRLASTGASFTSVTAALAKAASGDTITLLDDVRDASAVSVSQNVTVDLAGHVWRVDAGAKATSGAVSVSGSASFTVRDSSDGASGRLEVTLGSSNETIATTYSGLANSSTGTLRVDGASVQVTYTGQATSACAVRTVGISAASGKVALAGGSKLSVQARDGEEGCACSEVVGVLVGGSVSRDALEVDASSAIEVANDGVARQDGAQYIDSSTLNNANPILKRITPAENTDLYQEILDKFRTSATLDESANSNGYGARVYHADEMLLDDGTMVWACSDYVAAGEETLGNIKPKVIFVRSTYDVVPQAIGISGEVTTNIEGTTSTAGGATVKGSVVATAANGEASAVKVRGSGSWLLDGASLSALGSDESFMKRGADGALNLGDFIASPSKPESWFYPYGNKATLVSKQDAQSQALSLDDGVDVTLSGSTALSSSGGAACDVRGSGLRVTSTFASASGEAITVGNAAGANTVGDVICSPASSGQDALSRSLFKDAFRTLSPNRDASGNLVWEDSYTVTFESDSGTVASYAGLVYGDVVALPSAAAMKKEDSLTTSYDFIGWAKSPNATKNDIVLAADATLATVSGSVSYYPVYQTHARTVNVQFVGAKDASGAMQGSVSVVAEYGRTLAQSRYGSSSPWAADYSDAGATYRFVGWRDSNGMVWDGTSFDTEVAIDANIAGSRTGTVTLYAEYVRVGQGQCLVRFKADSSIKAYAARLGTRPSYLAATGESSGTPSKIATATGYAYTFAGWHAGRLVAPRAADVDFSAGTDLPQVTGDAFYTACFSESKIKGKVRFVALQKLDDGTYAKVSSESVEAEYGQDVIGLASKVAKIGDVVAANGRVYTMLGWSVRSSDKEPLFTDSIPFTPDDGTVTYYAIYSEVEQTASITFYDGTAEYAKVEDFAVSGTVEAAFEQTGKSSPADKSAARVFKGWSSSKEAASVNVDMNAAVYTVSDGASSVSLYAVYGDAYKPTVTFVDAEGNVLGSESVEAGTTLAEIEMPSVPAREGMYLAGWALTSTGEVLDIYQALTSDVRLEPKYSAIESIADPNDPERTFEGFADVSKASLTSADALGASSVVFMIDNASTLDATLESQASLNGDSIISGAVYKAFYSIDQKKLEAAGDIGAVRINVSCASIDPSSKVRVYWKRGDGSVGYTSALEQESGSVTFTMSSYSSLSTDGNLAVAEVGAGTKALAGNGGAISSPVRTTSGLSNVASGTMTKTAAASSGSLPSGTGEASAAAQASLEAGTLSDTGAEAADGVDVRAAAERIAGNPLAWAAALLGAGGIGAAVWWALIGRKRKVVEDDEAGWSDDDAADGGADGQGCTDAVAGAAATASASRPHADDSSKVSGGISF